MRRCHVRGTDNVMKRVLVQAAGFNIGLLLRKLSGWGKPRQPQGRTNALTALLSAVFTIQSAWRAVWNGAEHFRSQFFKGIRFTPALRAVSG
jgi:hypothetical protein